MTKAKVAAQNEIVIGFVVGNEGLDDKYDYETLWKAIQTFSVESGKSVTTTEEITDYSNPQVLEPGDWVFPNVHPFFHGFLDPLEAVGWIER